MSNNDSDSMLHSASNSENSKAQSDPFDLSKLRLSQDFVASAGIKKILTTVPTRKPSKEWFVQTHPDQNYRIQTYVIELKEDSETYLVVPELWPNLSMETTFSPRLLITSINRQGVLFLWPIRLPSADGRHDEWSRSALEAASLASGRWVRVVANMGLGAYESFEAAGQWSAPEWTELPFQQILKMAFKDRLIDRIDHPILKRLRGEL